MLRRSMDQTPSDGRRSLFEHLVREIVPSLVPTYVTHLLTLGLAETAPEESALEDEYQILLTEAEVKDAHAEAKRATRRSPRIVRGTLRISTLGREFWAACQLDGDVR